jgi:hypothetical protein
LSISQFSCLNPYCFPPTQLFHSSFSPILRQHCRTRYTLVQRPGFLLQYRSFIFKSFISDILKTLPIVNDAIEVGSCLAFHLRPGSPLHSDGQCCCTRDEVAATSILALHSRLAILGPILATSFTTYRLLTRQRRVPAPPPSSLSFFDFSSSMISALHLGLQVVVLFLEPSLSGFKSTISNHLNIAVCQPVGFQESLH